MFVKDGIIVQAFPSGKYTLKTGNFPGLDTVMRKVALGGNSLFTCKVYFVDKSHNMELLWGTPTPIQMNDPIYDFHISLRASGSYSAQVIDAKKFFLKMVGNNIQLFTRAALTTSFRTAFVSKIKAKLTNYIVANKKSVLNMSNL